MGLLAALVSACTSTAKDLVSKAVSSRVHPDVSTFASFLFALPFYGLIFAAFVITGGEAAHLSRQFIVLVILRSISDVFAEGCKMRALEKGDVSLVTGLLSISPLILTLISPFITGDTVLLSEAMGIGLIVLGGLIIIRRDRQTGKVVQSISIAYALGGSVFFALNTALDRLAVGQAGPVTSAFSVTLCAAVFSLPAIKKIPNVVSELRLNSKAFLLRGGFETVFMVAKMVALTTLPAHVVLGVMRLSILFTVVVGGSWFNEHDRGRRIVGTLVMYVGLLCLIL